MELGFILLMVLIVPFMLLWPALVWAGAICSLYRLIRHRVRYKVPA
jgi:hypothetical protein